MPAPALTDDTEVSLRRFRSFFLFFFFVQNISESVMEETAEQELKKQELKKQELKKSPEV